MANGWLIAAVGLGGAALAYALYKRAQPAVPSDDCAPLKALNPQAYVACESAKAALNILGDVADAVFTTEADYDKKEQNNTQRNGAVDVTADAHIAQASYLVGSGPASGAPWTKVGRVLRYKNGCVPFDGTPGWAKCAAGTEDMTYQSAALEARPSVPSTVDGTKGIELVPTSFHSIMSGINDGPGGETVDPTTHGDFPDTATWFPLPIPKGGVGYYYQGKPYVCPAGQMSSARVRNHTGTARGPGCVDISSAPPAHITAGADQSTGYDTATGPNPPPGFTWVAKPAPGHWERARAGQAPVPRPSSGTSTVFTGSKAA